MKLSPKASYLTKAYNWLRRAGGGKLHLQILQETPEVQMGSNCLHGSALLYSVCYSPNCSVLLFCYSISRCLSSRYFVVLFVCVCCCRLLSVLCCNLDSFLLLESQYNICSMLLQSQRENVTERDTNEGYEPKKKRMVDIVLILHTV